MDEKEKDLEGAPLARGPLTDAELDSLGKLLSGRGPGTWVFGGDSDGLGKAVRQRGREIVFWDLTTEDYECAAEAMNAAPALLAEVRSGRAWRAKAVAALTRILADGYTTGGTATRVRDLLGVA